ncbi:uncharacterized protein LOC110942571 isoform X2 [Helianthus annuus]|uniref:uncharacterized protein LOC110942571 isoform X2 n=1 Tax=Helianthus annuus TaxID=4232 RepID=UPI001652BA63|nr:uncharacterized protein LOC110942571 isoform X2 [Helianthus annuus]
MSSSTEDMDFDELLDSLLILIDEIELATNNFADDNLLTRGTSFDVYKGQLLLQSGDLINIVARKCREFSIAVNEIMLVKDLKHKNIVPIYKLAATVDNATIIINKYEASESLDKHLGSPTLTWMRRLLICVGVADALSYLHYDAFENQYVIHGNIKSSKILLDRNWEPKLHGFKFAVSPRKHHIHLTNKYNGSLHYMDPAYEDTRGLNHKSDIFSFGVVLFEVLFGREASIPNDDNWYFARKARAHYEERKLDNLIDPDLHTQMNVQSFNLFAEIAYCCIKEQRSQRPDMNTIRTRLERALELQRKHEQSTVAAVEGTTSNHFKGKSLDHLRLRLTDIELATDKFSETCCIGSGGYGMVYKAELDHFDGMNSLKIEEKNKGEFRKKHSCVAIKRLHNRVDAQGEQGFVSEIETLSNCKHPNIVSLLGFCDEGRELILVYEYVAKGSLDDYLGNMDGLNNLLWAQRLQICLDIAHGLNYLHTHIEGKPMIIHRDIKSANILLDDNWVAKIADFGLSKLQRATQQGTTLITNNIAGTEVYLDPEYKNTGKLKKESDIYSFGVVLFEVLCGRLAYDEIYGGRGLPSVARQRFNDGTFKEMVDPKLMEADEIISMLKGGVNQDSLETFSKIAHQCLAETQSGRPTMEVIIKELEKALNFQCHDSQKNKDNLHISLKAIKLGTQNFSDCNCIGEGRFWKLYEGEVDHAFACTRVVVKRWDEKYHQGYIQFLKEFETLLKCKHENIIGLVGYCNEMKEKIIVYEHACNGSLAKHLDNPTLTWMKRLKICIDAATGLKFLHEGGVDQQQDLMVHRDIRSGSILLDADWNAKISNLEFSTKVFERAQHLDDNACFSLGYIDPEYEPHDFLTQPSDIYSLGVILCEMLCGRLAWAEGCKHHSQSLGPLFVKHYNEKGDLDEMIFEGIKEQITPQSLTTLQMIAIQCLQVDGFKRPTIDQIIIQLQKALEFQEDYEIWEPKLPIDYKEIIQVSKNPQIYKQITKKGLYDMFSKGILLQGDKVWFSIGSNGDRNEMISSKRFSYKDHLLREWRSIPVSRFPKVAEMLNISNLNIQIKIRTQFLSPCVNYKVHLIFRFRGPRKSQAKRMYVNLKYKMGNESLNAYFATWREDGWMMIELFQFLNHKKDTDFEVLLEGFSRCYCGSDSIYIEGIQFQAIDNARHEAIENHEEIRSLKWLPFHMSQSIRSFQNGLKNFVQVKHKEIEKLKDVYQAFKSKSKTDKLWNLPNPMKEKKDQTIWFSLCQIKKKKDEMLFANEDMLSTESGFTGAIECSRQQILHIKCKIKRQMLLENTQYTCYLVFKLSEKCHGLHGPVIVRDLFNWRSKETGVLYFRHPNPWNVRDTDWVPRQRKDGWMEVIVWKFNSNYEPKNDHLFVNLKLITYEGTMSGLIVRGIEFRPI